MESKRNKFVYKPVIKKIITDLLHRDKDISSVIPFRIIPDVPLFMDYDKYIHLLYRDIFTVNIESSFMAVMYRSILSQQDEIKLSPMQTCAFNVQIYLEEKQLYHVYFSNNGFEEYKFGVMDHENFQNFVKAILEIGTVCKFFVIDFSIYPSEEDTGHTNVAFVENIGTFEDPKLILNYYEPHGSSDIIKGITKILDRIQSVSNQQIKANYYGTHMYVGAQTYSKDSLGYCTMFSIFWIYVVLNIVVYNINNDSYIPSTYWIDEVEEYYMSMLTDREMYKIVVLFAGDQFNNYVNEISIQKDGQQILGNLFARIQESGKAGPFQLIHLNNLYPDEKDPRRISEASVFHKRKDKIRDQTSIIPEISARKLEKLAREDPEYTYEAWDRARKKENKELSALKEFRKHRGYGDDYNPKLRLGKSCKRNNECQSKRCIIDNETGKGYCGAPLRSSRMNE